MTARPAAPRLWPQTWPLLLELLLGIGVGVVGTLLAARLSDTSGAAFALAQHVFQALFILFRIIGAGVGVVIAQALGAGRPDEAARTARATLGASTRIGVGLALAAAIVGGPLLDALQAPADVRPLAQGLLLALAPTLLLDAWNAGMAAVMRAHLRARDTLLVMVAMHGLQLLLMGPLMFGVGAWPGLGLAGFAVALLASRGLALALHLALWRLRLGLVPQRVDWLAWRGDVLAPVARIGGPGAAENLGWRLAFMASVAAVGSLGSTALSTHAYTQQVMMVILLVGLANGLAAEVLVGHLIGAGRLREAHALVRRALARGLAASLLLALAAAMAGPWLMRAFSRDEAIVQQACVLLWWTVLLEPGRTFNLVVINALRAAGDARYPVAAGSLSMLVVLAGGSWLLAHAAGLGLVGVWIAYAADEWLRGLLMWRRWVRLRWLPHARASRHRLARSQATPAASG